MAGWRATLLMAARQAWRSKGRSALVVALVALPVAVVTFAATAWSTQDVTGVEGLDRSLGTAEALVWQDDPELRVMQAPDPFRDGWTIGSVSGELEPVVEGSLSDVLPGARTVEFARAGWTRIRVGRRAIDLDVTEADLDDPLTRGMFELTDGRLPAVPGEAVINDALVSDGLAIGDTLGEGGPEIVGIGRDAQTRSSGVAYGLPGSFDAIKSGQSAQVGYLVGGEPVTWEQVQELNAMGWIVASRHVLTDPPAHDEYTEMTGSGYVDDGIEVGALIALLVLIEVVLLAGPAFAVGARQHSRAIALVSLNGGTPAQARRVVMASAVVLGLVATVVGLVTGIAAAAAGRPLLQLASTEWFGPFEVPWLWLIAVAAFGLVSALLSAAVPAWFAAREDVVRVLAGRRGDSSPDPKLPILGLVLLALGIAGATLGAVDTGQGGGTGVLALSILVGVIGMVLVVPVVVTGVARVATRLPLSARYATRDAARHRSRSVPAVAAVAATVAGVVALGIGTASDATEVRETYAPSLPMGTAAVTWWNEMVAGEQTQDPERILAELAEVVGEVAPDLDVHPVRGVAEESSDGRMHFVSVESPRDEDGFGLLNTYNGAFASSILAEDSLGVLGLDGEAERVAAQALAAGRVVAFATRPHDLDEVELRVESWTMGGTQDDEQATSAEYTVPAVVLEVDHAYVAAVLPDAVFDKIGVRPATVSLHLTGDIDEALTEELTERLGGADTGASLYVETGSYADDLWLVTLVLWISGLALMLAGTLTATFLAIGDARSDLATLQAVGAEPRTRRRVAASYAFVVSGIGVLLGVVVGFVPGVAVARSLTYADYWGDGVATGPFVTIPWLLIAGVVIGLPLLAAGVVALTARSRLPMVARID